MSPETGSFRRDTTDTADPRVVEALEIYLQALEAGERPNRENFLALHAEIASALAPCLDGMEWVKAAARSFETADHAVHAMKSGDFFQTPVRLGDYRIERELGRGGMGIVYEAIQESLGRRVALKVLPLATALDPRQRQRFRVEAQAAAHLHHTHIVPVFAIGSDQGIDYYAMQYIEGRTLADLVRELRELGGLEGDGALEGTGRTAAELKRAAAWLSGHFPASGAGSIDPTGVYSPGQAATAATNGKATQPTVELPAPNTSSSTSSGDSSAEGLPKVGSSSSTYDQPFFRAVARIGQQVAEALEHAHGLGVLHRDIKPANLILDQTGEIWITDFGLARFQEDLGLTLTGDLLGTLRYMSPEQALGQRVVIDHRTDVYSLGITLYELVTLTPAFAAKDRPTLLRQIAHEEPISPRRLNPWLPRDLETIILKSMAKDPAQRYTSASELVEDLRRFQQDRPILARRPSPLEMSARWARRHKTLVAFSGAFLLVSALGLATANFVLWQEQRKTTETLHLAFKALDQFLVHIGEQEVDQGSYQEALSQEAKIQKLVSDSLELYDRLTEQHPRDPSARWEQARALHRIGEIWTTWARAWGVTREDEESPEKHKERERQLITRAYGSYRKAESVLTQLVADHPKHRTYREQLIQVLQNVGQLALLMQRPKEAEPVYQRALRLAREMAGDYPSERQPMRRQGECLHGLGNSQGAQGKLVQQLGSYEQSSIILGRLSTVFPKDEEVRLALAAVQQDLGNLYLTSQRPEDARRIFDHAISNLDHLISMKPTEVKFREMAAKNYTTLTLPMVVDPNLNPEAAEQAYRRALEMWEGLPSDSPHTGRYRLNYALVHLPLVRLMLQTRRYREAEELEQTAIRELESLVKRYRDRDVYLSNLIKTLRQFCYFQWYVGRPKATVGMVERLVEISPQSVEFKNNLAWFLATTPVLEERDPSLAESVVREALESRPDEWAFWNTLGVVLARLERWGESKEALEKAMSLEDGGSPHDWYFLAIVNWHLGKKEESRSWYKRAEAEYLKSAKANHELEQFRIEAAETIGGPAPPPKSSTAESEEMIPTCIDAA
jgi:serine/threonine protein kinase/predicted Zn-dependent protease